MDDRLKSLEINEYIVKFFFTLPPISTIILSILIFTISNLPFTVLGKALHQFIF